MATDCIPQLTFTFQEKQRPVVARFDQSHASTDGARCCCRRSTRNSG